MMRKISIDPITRLEGHGRIEIFLNDEGDVERAFLQVPELRGFERFAVGRHAELLSKPGIYRDLYQLQFADRAAA